MQTHAHHQEASDFLVRLTLDDDSAGQELRLSRFLNANLSFLSEYEVRALSNLRVGQRFHGGSDSGWDWTIERIA